MFQERGEEEQEEEELEEVFEELETVGRSLLDRLSIPVVFPDGYTLLLTHQCTHMNTAV